MKIHIDDSNTYKIISYSDKSFQLQDKTVESNLILYKNKIIENWLNGNHKNLTIQHLNEVVSWMPDIIILGTGKKLIFPEQKIIHQINKHNIGFEVMDTGAACRSYNLLANERKNVAACLILNDN